MSLKRFLIIIVAAAAFTNLLVFAPSAHAQYSTGTLAQNVWFDALGSRQEQGWGYNFMAVLPPISDSIQHPMAISEDAGATAAYILNRFPVDTARIYTFPSGMVVPGHISGSPYTDFVCWDAPDRRITVLFGTAVDSIFDTALVLQGDINRNEFGQYVTILVDNFDSSNVQGFIIGDFLYQNPAGLTMGRILYYKGGSILDTEPTDTIIGIANNNVVGYNLMTGRVRDPRQKYFISPIEHQSNGSDTILFYLYKYCSNFTINNADDSIICVEQGGSWGFLITDATGDSIDDIVSGAGDNGIKIYAGGENISPLPTFTFHNMPFPQNSGEFGDVMCNVGDVSGNGYDYLLVANTTQDAGAGAIYLYPIGKGLKDTCVAYAEGSGIGTLGITMAAVGDVNGDGLADFYVGGTTQGNGHDYSGGVIAYLGDKGYVTAVEECANPQPVPEFTLLQNYPNPFSTTTEISFAVSDFAYNSKPVTLDVFDMQGRKIANVYSGSADLAEHVIQLDASRLSAGNYFYRLSGGGIEKERMFTVFR